MSEKIHPSLVQSIEIFRELTLEECRDIAAKLSMVSYAGGEIIVSRNDENRAVFFVVTGSVRVTSFAANGRESSYHDKTSGAMFGELAALDGSPRTADVLAVSSATLLTMQPAEFVRLVENYPLINKKLIQLLTAEVRSLTQRVYEFSALNVRSRIHKRVFELAREAAGNANEVILDQFPKHTEIASRVTTTREAVTREISRLCDLGLLTKSDKGLFIPDINKLQRILHDGTGQ